MLNRTMHCMFALSLVLVGSLVAVGCGGGGGGEVASTGFDDKKIVEDYTSTVVLPTYQTLDEKAAGLKGAVDTFLDDSTQGNLDAARQAWIDSRTPWERSEAFLFGPVDSNGYDPALDSWPVNKTDLDGILTGGDELNEEYLANLDPAVKGFHTIEYLLFGEGGTKTPDDFTDREKTYLKLTTAELAGVATDLAKSWTEGVDGNQPYKAVFMTAGGSDNTAYPSLQSAGQQIVDGMAIIVDEVGNGKIADPYTEKDPTLVESQFSYNSLTDFANNIKGVKAAYMTQSIDGASGNSLSSWVAEQDADLDSRVKSEIDAAIAAIEAIPEPFRDAITDDAGREKIQAAIDALSTLQTTLEGDLKKLVSGK